MAEPIYTERDSVLKESSVEKMLKICSRFGLDVHDPDRRREIVHCLDEARAEGRSVSSESAGIAADWDSEREEYVVVVKDFYDPANLMTILYERLLSVESGDAAEDKAKAADLISRYLGVIEEKEKLSLAEAKERLAHLADEMKTTLHLFLEDEFSEEDLARLSEILNSTYFEPISELLEGVLVAIAGN